MIQEERTERRQDRDKAGPLIPKSSGVPNNSQNRRGTGTEDRDGSEVARFGFPEMHPCPSGALSPPEHKAHHSATS